MRTSYSVLGARKMHVMLNRPEVAERHGAGHVARCTVERLMGDLGLPRRQARQVAQDDPLGPLRTGVRPTWSGVTSRPSPWVGCGSPTFPRKREVPPPMCVRSRGGSMWLS